MYHHLQQHISKYVTLTSDEWTVCQGAFLSKPVRKKHYLLQQQEVCKYLAFVEEGLLRSFTVDSRGTEHIIQFALPGWWISDMFSFLTGEPSIYTIEALEDSQVLLLDGHSQEQLFEQVPKMERYFRQLLQKNYIATHRRLEGSLSQTAEEKYAALIATYPQIIQSVPQHMIASYLGITPAFLSRLLNRKAHQK
ncbi:Crp/Fnr family transcriptional regulator [Rhodocytophaga aerolata]|uniref:Crp/Fnr family transcriptional regulator n=1 Tax=Rhodocytophaga aerolata TaxID=455078 RepID=A0ABT8RB14_9BACT|nr:Crp/Fnr family transcriptional regulator [Rhodocytophaga aerolata]MDO1449194.1 Crp/Fnr family transcriptional regulator [Rhodocytophaga aerolata]